MLRIEGNTYFVKEESGKEVRLHTSDTAQKAGDINDGWIGRPPSSFSRA